MCSVKSFSNFILFIFATHSLSSSSTTFSLSSYFAEAMTVMM